MRVEKNYSFILRIWVLTIFILLATSGLFSCQPTESTPETNRLKVIATTSLVGDVVSQVGADRISLKVLLPLGSDPHSFSPTPQDASDILEANIIFANGAGLEEFLKPLLDGIGGTSQVIEVSEGIAYRMMQDEKSLEDQLVSDPHTWLDPNNIIIWVENIVQALSEHDPENAPFYYENGQAYQSKLRELDRWIRSEVSAIPETERKLVTDHMVFGYFSAQYGFSQVAAIIPGFSSLAEPSAQDIAQIEDAIKALGVKAIFINVGANANISRRISEDTGVQLVTLYMHSLSEKHGEAGNYLDYMRYDVKAIVNALK
jgi:ABC-type Zn uptake system ZnuABC Zn-binding protein ZnuA